MQLREMETALNAPFLLYFDRKTVSAICVAFKQDNVETRVIRANTAEIACDSDEGADPDRMCRSFY